MADIYRADIADVDLSKPLARSNAGELLATGDKLANRFGASVYRDKEKIVLTGYAVTGYFIRPGHDTVVIAGTVSGNMAYVDLPQACYIASGAFSLAIKISGGGITQTVRIIDGYIRLTQTNDLIDPGTVVPTLDDVLAQIAACEAAASAANTAATAANEAAVDVREAADEISKTAAPAIIPTATGDGIVVVNDSAARPLAGLRIYGKTTQDGTPSPDNPVPLVSIGADEGSITVKAQGGNLLVADLADTHKEWASRNADGSITVNNTTATYVYPRTEWICIPQGTYTAQAQYDATKDMEIYVQQVEGDYSRRIAAGQARTWTLTEPNPVRILLKVGAGINATTAVQLTSGESVASVAPYMDGGSVAVSAPNGLPGIPVTSGGNFNDEDGRQWYCDEIDLDKGVYIQRVGNLSGTYTIPTGQTSAGGQGWLEIASDFWVESAAALCNILTYTPNSYDGWIATTPALSNADGNLRLYGAKGESYTVDLLYALATPMETAIDDETLAAYAAMASQKPTTTVYNDVGAGMAVDYIADTQTYIDNKFAALAAKERTE